MKRLGLLVSMIVIVTTAFGQESDVALKDYFNINIRTNNMPNGVTRNIIATMGDKITDSKVSLLGTYANPTWMQSLAGSKITGSISTATIPFANVTSTPTTLAGYGITNGQILNANLTAISGLSFSNDDFLQYKSGALANRTIAQVKTDLGIPTSFSDYLRSGITNTQGAATIIDKNGFAFTINGTGTLNLTTGSNTYSVSNFGHFFNSKQLSLAGDLFTSGASAITFTSTGTTGVTLPTSGTLATTTQLAAKQDVLTNGNGTTISGTQVNLGGNTTGTTSLNGGGVANLNIGHFFGGGYSNMLFGTEVFDVYQNNSNTVMFGVHQFSTTLTMPLAGHSAGQVLTSDGAAGWIASAPSVPWGSITGTLSSQTDLQAAMDLKVDAADIVTDTGTTIGDIQQLTTVGSPNTYSPLHAVATGNVIISGGVGAAWTAGKITASHITNATITGTQLASSIAVPGNPTTTTQSANTNNTTIGTTAYADAKVVDAITNGVTTIAPAQNVVFDNLALKVDLASSVSDPGNAVAQILYLSATGTPNVYTALSIGTPGQVLTVSVGGLPQWAPATGGMTNPMNCIGCMIQGTTAGAPANLTPPATASSILLSGGTGVANFWSTTKWPNAITSGRLLFGTASNTAGESADMSFSTGGIINLGSTSSGGSGITATYATATGGASFRGVSGATGIGQLGISSQNPYGGTNGNINAGNLNYYDLQASAYRWGIGPDGAMTVGPTSASYGFRVTQAGVANVNSKAFVGGTTTPTAVLHLVAGTTAASTAPLKFTSGSLQTTAEAGAVEFLIDKFYAAITTGAARKEFTLNDAALTSGIIPIGTTNGRITNWTDPNAHTIVGWDDTDGANVNITVGTGLTYTHATHTLSAAAGIGGSTGATDNAVIASDGTGGATVQSRLAFIDDLGNIQLGTVATAGRRSIDVASSDNQYVLDITSGGVTMMRLLAAGNDLQFGIAGASYLIHPPLSSGSINTFTVQGQSSSSGNTNGGNLILAGGSPNGTGVQGIVRIKGTPTNDTPTAGDVGEEINAIQSTYTNYTTTATYQNIASITLTAGDWDLSAFFTYSSNSATITAAANAIFAISTTTASASGATEGLNISYVPQAALLGTSKFSDAIPSYRVSITGSTTYYLNSQATFTLGNPQFVGGIRARRLR